ncbi:MAG: thioredoxin domain-containing protein [Fibrella sp.]|nr:thioredoxin domain-containing protein [Armatimonadota bacterium]
MATLKVDVEPGRDHILGSVDASVTLVEYGDYECPHCAKAQPVVEAMRKAMGDNLRVVFRSFPLGEIHKHAQHASEAAEAAGEQGKFWEMHDSIFAHQSKGLSDEKLLTLAGEIGADKTKIESALRDGTFTDRVKEDFMSGIRSGVNATPTFFVNGTRHDDSWDEETLLAALQSVA